MQKGLFSSLFVLIMIVFFTPSLMINDPSISVMNNYNHLNLLTLAADNVVSDALLEKTFDNDCVVANASEYDDLINNYLNQLKDETNNKFFLCKITSSSIGFEGATSNLSGNVKVNCNSSSSQTYVSFSKELKFKKSITAQITVPDPVTNPEDPDTCTVIIKDLHSGNEITSQDTRDMP